MTTRDSYAGSPLPTTGCGVIRTGCGLRSNEVAENEMLDERPLIALDDEAWDAFTAALGSPVDTDLEVKARFVRRPQWDR